MLESLLGRKHVDVAPIVRRIIDLTTPNHTVGVDLRAEQRYNRAFPVLLTPWVHRRPQIDQSLVVFSRDLSDHGIGLVTQQELAHSYYVVTVWPPQVDVTEPYHFLTHLCEQRPIAIGLWLAGFEIVEYLNRRNRRDLNSLNQAAVCTLKVINDEPPVETR